jgi:hypothetical protein
MKKSTYTRLTGATKIEKYLPLTYSTRLPMRDNGIFKPWGFVQQQHVLPIYRKDYELMPRAGSCKHSCDRLRTQRKVCTLEKHCAVLQPRFRYVEVTAETHVIHFTLWVSVTLTIRKHIFRRARSPALNAGRGQASSDVE